MKGFLNILKKIIKLKISSILNSLNLYIIKVKPTISRYYEAFRLEISQTFSDFDIFLFFWQIGFFYVLSHFRIKFFIMAIIGWYEIGENYFLDMACIYFLFLPFLRNKYYHVVLHYLYSTPVFFIINAIRDFYKRIFFDRYYLDDSYRSEKIFLKKWFLRIAYIILFINKDPEFNTIVILNINELYTNYQVYGYHFIFDSQYISFMNSSFQFILFLYMWVRVINFWMWFEDETSYYSYDWEEHNAKIRSYLQYAIIIIFIFQVIKFLI